MKNIVKFIEKIFGYTNFVFVGTCAFYAIVCVFYFIFETPWLLFGAVVLNMIGVTVLYLIYEKKLKTDVQKIGDQIEEFTEGIKEINASNRVKLENETEFSELNELKENIDNLVDNYNNRLNSTVFIEGMAIDFDMDNELPIASKESFEKELPSILKRTKGNRSLFCLVKLCGGEDKSIRHNLCIKIKEIFPKSIIAAYDDFTISVLVLNVGGDAEIEGSIKRLVSVFAHSVSNEYEDKTDVYYCRVGAAIHPNIFFSDLIQCAKTALNKNLPYCIYGGRSFSNEKGDAQRKEVVANLIQTILEKTNKANTPSEKFETIKDATITIAKLFKYNHVSIFVLNNDGATFNCVFDKYTDNPGHMFRGNYVKTLEEVKPILKLYDKSGVLYFTSPDHIDPKAKEYFDNYGIKSTYKFYLKHKNEIVGIISFDNDEENVELNALERDGITAVTNILLSMCLNYLFEIEQYRVQNLTEALAQKFKQYIYVIDKNSYQIKYVSPLFKLYRPNIKVGDLCYKAIMGKDAPCANCPLKDVFVEFKDSKFENKTMVASVLHYLSVPQVEATIVIEEKQEQTLFNTKPIEIGDIDNALGIKNINRLHVDIDELMTSKQSGYITLINVCDYLKNVETTSQKDVDEAMTFIADRLKIQGYKDFIYRYNDSTLAVLIFTAKKTEALEKVESIFNNLSREITLLEYNVKWDYNLSLVRYPNDIRNISRLDKVLNTARDESIALGPNSIYVFGDKGGRRAERSQYVLSLIDEAIQKDKFELFIQPIVSSKDDKTPIYGEALLRLKDHNKNFVSPGEFVPIANANNRMFGVEMSILNQIGELWRANGYTIFQHAGVERISVNISASTLQHPDFVTKVTQICKKFKFGKKFLQFEITEKVVEENIDIIANHIKDLAQFNISWAVDNFGTGYSDLSELLKIGFEQVKVDRNFIIDLDNNDRNVISMKLIADIVKKENCTIVACGIETEEQLNAVKQCGFNASQGYLFAKPSSVTDYIKYLNFGN